MVCASAGEHDYRFFGPRWIAIHVAYLRPKRGAAARGFGLENGNTDGTQNFPTDDSGR
jgi:hypothetical protein